MRTYGEEIANLPDELRYAMDLDIASRPDQFGLLLETFVASLLVGSEEAPVPIRSMVKTEIKYLEPPRAKDVVAESIRLFKTGYHFLRLEPTAPKGIE